jgi:lipoate-protein ligase A
VSRANHTIATGAAIALPEPPVDDVFPPWIRDEDLLSRAARETRAVVRVAACDAVEVVIGRGGRPDLELDLDAIEADGVPVHRRRGGGCAVVLDPGNLLVSAAAPLAGVGGVTSAFRTFTDWVVGGLSAAGIPGVRGAGVSDLVLDDCKVGGSCIYRTRGLVYYSTTLLVDPDLARVARYLPHPPREPAYRRGRAHGEFMGRLPVADPAAFSSRLSVALGAPPDLAG